MGLLKTPVFKPVPNSTAANVEENIIHWKKKRDKKTLAELCIPDETQRSGYRFKHGSDFTETVLTKQLINGLWFNIVWIRYYYAPNSSFYPLSYSELSTDIILMPLSSIRRDIFYYESDAHLKRYIQSVK